MTPNRLRARWAEHRPVVGVSATLGSPFAAEVLASSGVDYVCVDLQHGLSHLGELAVMMAGVTGRGCAPLVRVPANRHDAIGKALDAGAHGVIVPMVDSGAEAARAAAACRYAPMGDRSYGPVRSGLVWSGGLSVDEINAHVLCVPMVETAQAVDAVDEIAGTPGVDAIFIGPSDLALTLGLPPPTDSFPAPLMESIHTVTLSARRHGVAVGIHATGSAQAAMFLEIGLDFVTLSTDTALLRAAVTGMVADVEPAAERRSA